MVNWLRWHWETSADPWSLWIEARRKAETLSENVGVARQGPGIGGPGEHHWPADLLSFLRGSSVQALKPLELYKRVGPEDTSRQAKFFN